jgi:hypothetical protein
MFRIRQIPLKNSAVDQARRCSTRMRQDFVGLVEPGVSLRAATRAVSRW